MKHLRLYGFALVGLFLLSLVSSPGLLGQAKPAAPASGGRFNLYQEIVAHEGAIVWITASAPSLPSEVCKMFKTCSGAAPKSFLLPAATLGGKRTQRALFLVATKDPQRPDIVLVNESSSAGYAFLLDLYGNLKSTAYLESGKPWYLIANSLAQSRFDRDQKDWHDWVSKLGAKTP